MPFEHDDLSCEDSGDDGGMGFIEGIIVGTKGEDDAECIPTDHGIGGFGLNDMELIGTIGWRGFDGVTGILDELYHRSVEFG